MKKLIALLLITATAFANGEMYTPNGIVSKGHVSIGSVASARGASILDVQSTTQGFNPPSMTTTQMNAISNPFDGLIVYNTSTHQPYAYENGAWTTIGSVYTLPPASSGALGGVYSIASAAHQWLYYIDNTGLPHLSQPAFSDLSGSASSSQLPAAGISSLGAIFSIASVSHEWLSYIDNTGLPHLLQPNFSDLTGSATSAQLPGDVAYTDQNNVFSGTGTSPTQTISGTSSLSQQLVNDTSTGTSNNHLVKISSAAAAITTSTSDTQGAVGIVISGGGTSGSATVALVGSALCVFDNTATAGDYVQISSSVAGDCTDAGSSKPATGQVIGRVTASGTGTKLVLLSVGGGGSGSVTSVSVASANGLGGTVATNTSTPVISLSTTITGMVKGNGTALQQAVAGTDYVATNGHAGLDLQIANNLSDVASAPAALNNILPSQSGQADAVLGTNGTVGAWKEKTTFENILVNHSFENSSSLTGWTESGSGQTGSQDTTNYFHGLASRFETYSSSTAGLLYQDVSTSAQLGGVNMEYSCRVKTTSSNIQVCARQSGATVGSCVLAPSSGTFQNVSVYYPGNPSATSYGVSVGVNGTSTTGTANVDDCYVGPARTPTNVQQGGYLLGTVTINATSSFNVTATSFTNFGTQSSGYTCTATGLASCPAANTLGITFASIPAGDLSIELDGAIFPSNNNTNTYFRFSDGTNVTRETSAAGPSTNNWAMKIPLLKQSINYSTSQSNVTFQPQAEASTGSISIGSSVTGLPTVMRVYYFPTSTQLQTPYTSQVTITKELSGTGTYTVPSGVAWLEIDMVGGGAGGTGSGQSNTGGTGGAGSNTTFGSTYLVANGAPAPSGLYNGGSGASAASLPSGVIGFSYPGVNGSGGGANSPNQVYIVGGNGGGSVYFGGGGGGNASSNNGSNGLANTGGGGGGGSGISSSMTMGGGGGSGNYVHAIVGSPNATYSYSIGSGGTAGSAGTNGATGGTGGSGVIIITEHYNQTANTFAGSVTSSSPLANHVDSLHFGPASPYGGNCTSSPCTLAGAYTGWATVTRTGTGCYSLNFTAGEFSAGPQCNFSCWNYGGTESMGFVTSQPSSSTYQFCTEHNGSAVDSQCDVTCSGPH